MVGLTKNLKFIADGMLGKLTRWLRILGYDVEFKPNEADNKLLILAKETKKILLTGDLELYRKALRSGVEAFLVDGKTEVENLAKISKKFGINLDVDEVEETRCPKCNFRLKMVSAKDVEGKVPSTTLKTYKEFWVCTNPQCQKIYWQGSHWKKIGKILKEAKTLIN